MPVILLDTFEDAGDRTNRDLERLLQRLVWTMPNALSVITGRGRLLWADPALAHEHRLELDWLTDAAWANVSDSIWEPLAPPAAAEQPVPDSPRIPAEALAETLSALARRQHEHRDRTVGRLGAVLDSRLLPDDLTDLALYYRAKAQRDLGRSADSRQGMAKVAAGTPASPRPPAVASRTWPASPGTSPPRWPPPSPWAGRAATSGCRATCGGLRRRWTRAAPHPVPDDLGREVRRGPWRSSPRPSRSPAPRATRSARPRH
ncbi:hypothetical protein [Kitasatospora mediocidica]|uniref:hypothetical protein n=1 Tax=Kitasatospora mediocidica TaxID=58352 RepID=UPI0018DCD580|nr:hypothetical protein [Kitasatospora mediocidica]